MATSINETKKAVAITLSVVGLVVVIIIPILIGTINTMTLNARLGGYYTGWMESSVDNLKITSSERTCVVRVMRKHMTEKQVEEFMDEGKSWTRILGEDKADKLTREIEDCMFEK